MRHFIIIYLVLPISGCGPEALEFSSDGGDSGSLESLLDGGDFESLESLSDNSDIDNQTEHNQFTTDSDSEQPSNLIFQDNFDDSNLNGWNIINGNWSISNQINPKLKGAGDDAIISTNRSFFTFTLTYHVRCPNCRALHGRDGLIIRGNGNSLDKGYTISYDNKGQFLLEKDGEIVAITRTNWMHEKFTAIKVIATKKRFQIFRNEQLVIDYIDENPLPKGKVSFFTNKNDGKVTLFDDLKVWDNPKIYTYVSKLKFTNNPPLLSAYGYYASVIIPHSVRYSQYAPEFYDEEFDGIMNYASLIESQHKYLVDEIQQRLELQTHYLQHV